MCVEFVLISTQVGRVPGCVPLVCVPAEIDLFFVPVRRSWKIFDELIHLLCCHFQGISAATSWNNETVNAVVDKLTHSKMNQNESKWTLTLHQNWTVVFGWIQNRNPNAKRSFAKCNFVTSQMISIATTTSKYKNNNDKCQQCVRQNDVHPWFEGQP